MGSVSCKRALAERNIGLHASLYVHVQYYTIQCNTIQLSIWFAL